jgi:hypothetical protein
MHKAQLGVAIRDYNVIILSSTTGNLTKVSEQANKIVYQLMILCNISYTLFDTVSNRGMNDRET